jgi:protein O-mannosyl-transferase
MPSFGTRTFKGRPLFADDRSWRLFVLLAALLFVAAFKLSCRVAGYDFLALGDDDINVTLNPYLGHLDHDRWMWLLTDSSYVRRFMPLGWLTLCALFQVNGLDPFFYHSAAFAFYVVNVVLVYVTIAHVVRIFVPASSAGLGRWQVFASFLGAAWWAFHPLRVESTAWVSGMLYGQGATFFLLAFIAYLRSYVAALEGRPRRLWMALSFVAISASLLTYPIALGFGFLLLAMDGYWSSRSAPDVIPFRRLAAEKLLFFVPVAAVLAFTAIARMQNPAIWGTVPTFAEFPIIQRAMQACYIVAYYLWRPLYPLRMVPITSVLMDFNPWAPVFVLSLLGIAVICAVSLAWRRSRPWFGAIWLTYLAAVAPFIGYTEHPYYASDRYGYIPSIVLAAALAIGLSVLLSAKSRWIVAGFTLAVTAVLAATTDKVLGIWAGAAPMYGYLVSAIPPGEEHDRILSRFAMFDYLYGRPDEARAKIDICVRDFPASEEIAKVRSQIEDPSGRLAPLGQRVPIAFMHSQLGFYFLKKDEEPEAAVQLQRALKFDPMLFQSDYNLAILEAGEGLPRSAVHHLLLAEKNAHGAISPQAMEICGRMVRESATRTGDDALAKALAVRFPSAPR